MRPGHSGGFGIALQASLEALPLRTRKVTLSTLYTLYGLPTGKGRGAWLMNAATASVVRKMKDSERRFLWQGNLQAGEPDRLMGFRSLLPRMCLTLPLIVLMWPLTAGAGARFP